MYVCVVLFMQSSKNYGATEVRFLIISYNQHYEETIITLKLFNWNVAGRFICKCPV